MPMSRPSSPPIRPPANGIGLTLAGDEARDGSVPQLMTVVDDGKKIPYGPGFYVPPPGLPASAFTDQDNMRMRSRDDASPRKQKGANGRHSSVTGARTPSTCPSSVSSHGGRYVPDYGLDSDTESDYMKRGIKHPHADWTDRVLDGLIHSPLLDEPKLHR
ncbi:hypothetical protein PSEUBRA_003324 [Kalmanozyma brasiliensis GHG001]|uniref:uncharacterized protein n=1 Tax=Kalmanozyma brasiliensis (strain GHG001) TaxID=1365824 RepID=UPI002868307E|nr:uncharacterized protein PSEUBRA_003324 [Kalmanozyma brasiliensis GHG001]KAF6767221.1 hypothetical protein PSEUBRA_003324 [Kalmanozyma brasiliensis GHG001]